MLMINGLACLLIITSLCVIMVRTAKKSCIILQFAIIGVGITVCLSSQ